MPGSKDGFMSLREAPTRLATTSGLLQTKEEIASSDGPAMIADHPPRNDSFSNFFAQEKR
jgi:hypothetical protein